MSKRAPELIALEDIFAIVEVLEHIAAELVEPLTHKEENSFLRQQAQKRTDLDMALRRYKTAITRRVRAGC